MHDKRRRLLRHGRVDLVAARPIVAADEVVAGGHTEREWLRGIDWKRRLETANRHSGRLALNRLGLNDGQVPLACREPLQFPLRGVVALFLRQHPGCLPHEPPLMLGIVREPHPARRPRTGPKHLVEGSPRRELGRSQFGGIAFCLKLLGLLARQPDKRLPLGEHLLHPRRPRPDHNAVLINPAVATAVGKKGADRDRGRCRWGRMRHKLEVLVDNLATMIGEHHAIAFTRSTKVIRAQKLAQGNRGIPGCSGGTGRCHQLPIEIVFDAITNRHDLGRVPLAGWVQHLILAGRHEVVDRPG